MKRIIRAVAFACALIFICSVVWVVLFMVRAFFPSITAKITIGKAYADLVTLPGENRSAARAADTKHLPESGTYRYSKNPAEFSWEAQYDFRNLDSHPDLLFIRVFERFYGDTAFAVDLSARVARRASEQEWNDAVEDTYDGNASWVINPQGVYDRSQWFATGRVSLSDNGVAFDGKRYAWVGPSFRSAQISPSGKRIVLSSSSYLAYAPWRFLPWPRALTYFLDVYDAASGTHLVSAHGEMSEDQIVVGQERWFTDRYLIIPQSRGHEKLLLFDFGP